MQVTPIQTRGGGGADNHTYEASKYQSEDQRLEPNTKQLVFPSRPAHTERNEDPTQHSLWHCVVTSSPPTSTGPALPFLAFDISTTESKRGGLDFFDQVSRGKPHSVTSTWDLH